MKRLILSAFSLLNYRRWRRKSCRSSQDPTSAHLKKFDIWDFLNLIWCTYWRILISISCISRISMAIPSRNTFQGENVSFSKSKAKIQDTLSNHGLVCCNAKANNARIVSSYQSSMLTVFTISMWTFRS